MNWGDVPTWIAAIATVAAVIIATIAGVFAKRAAGAAQAAADTSLKLLGVEQKREDRQDRQERERHEAEERNHQAALVAAWQDPYEAGAVLHNQSKLPIRDVAVTFVNQMTRARYERPIEPVMGPGKAILDWPDALEADLEPGPRDQVQMMAEARSFAVEVTFRDTRGFTWLLDGEGYLHHERTDVSLRLTDPVGLTDDITVELTHDPGARLDDGDPDV